MGYRKLGLTVLLASFTFLNAAGSYEDYLKEQNTQFTQYADSIESEYKIYKEAYQKAFNEYSNNISKNWPNIDTSDKNKWVEYGKNFDTKKKVDFEKKEITLEVIAENKIQAKEKLKKLSNELVKDDVKTAYKNDQLQQKINKITKQEKVVKNTSKVIGDIVDKPYIMEKLKNITSKKVKNSDKFIYTVKVKLPPDSLIKKAKSFKSTVFKNAKTSDIPAELIYAIMHSESSFNPMARSYVPAYGLMQIVPKTAGIDTYKFLYGKKKLLSSDYLYDSDNNIKIGTSYLHILYYKYMKKIKNPISRMYCTIAAYNTGAGNVAKAFIGTYNINKAASKINSMTPSEVYKHLRINLPYDETKQYLLKVNNRVSVYKELIGNKI